MSKTNQFIVAHDIVPTNGTDTDDTYPQPPQPTFSEEEEDAIYSELYEQHLMREGYRQMVELNHHNERGH